MSPLARQLHRALPDRLAVLGRAGNLLGDRRLETANYG